MVDIGPREGQVSVVLSSLRITFFAMLFETHTSLKTKLADWQGPDVRVLPGRRRTGAMSHDWNSITWEAGSSIDPPRTTH